jgi:hypothetical protein
MWTEGPVLLGLGEHSRGPQRVFDAGFAFFNGLRRHDNVNDLSTPQWFRLSLKVIDDARRVLSFI